MYSELVLSSSYVYDVTETSKEVLAGLKLMLTFYLKQQVPQFYFFWTKATLHYSSYFCLKNITKIRFRNFL